MLTLALIMRDVIKAFFASEHIDVDTAEDGAVMRAGFQGENGRFVGYVRVNEDTGVVVFYTLSPVEVPPERMLAVLELVARINATSVLGNLDVDVDKGDIRFKTSVDVEGTEHGLTEDLFANLVWSNVASLDRALPAITAVVVKGAKPVDAVRAIEGT